MKFIRHEGSCTGTKIQYTVDHTVMNCHVRHRILLV